MICYLRMGDDYLEDATRCPRLGDAKAMFMEAARELDRYGQRIEASIHIADLHSKRLGYSDLHEYPDYVLSLGPRGGLKCERT